MAPPLLTLQDIRLSFGGKPLLTGADLSLSAGECLALVGRNGSGKSTLLRIAAGQIEADAGTRFLQPGTSIRYLPQEPDLSGHSTTLGYVEAGLGPLDDPYRARLLLEKLGFTGNKDPANLSGGETRRAALARVLAPEPDVLLLDEPTNHLDLPAIEWLESELAGLRSAIVLISHDRRFLQRLSRATLWLDRGAAHRLDRGFGEFETWRDAILEQDERERHKLDRRIAAEDDWVRFGVTGRRRRNQGRLARLQVMREAAREQRGSAGSAKIMTGGGQVSSKLVIEAEHVSKSFGERPIVKDFSIRVLRGDRIGIVGPNGVGKTTLVNLLIGVSSPDDGVIRHGENLALATLDQNRASLDPQATLMGSLTGGRGDQVVINGVARHALSYMRDFLFTPEQARTPVERLSGGERARLTLAKALSLPSNLLALDEPTNDLDLETLDVLQEMLSDYPGTVIVISHDRDFLDRVATSIIVAEGNGNWIEYAGGYSDMVAQRGFGVETMREETIRVQKPKDPIPAEQVPSRPAKRRLSFKEKHALEILPGRIKDLRLRCDRLREMLGDISLYNRDPVLFEKASNAFASAETELAEAEDKWLSLEMVREGLEQ